MIIRQNMLQRSLSPLLAQESAGCARSILELHICAEAYWDVSSFLAVLVYLSANDNCWPWQLTVDPGNSRLTLVIHCQCKGLPCKTIHHTKNFLGCHAQEHFNIKDANDDDMSLTFILYCSGRVGIAGAGSGPVAVAWLDSHIENGDIQVKACDCTNRNRLSADQITTGRLHSYLIDSILTGLSTLCSGCLHSVA